MCAGDSGVRHLASALARYPTVAALDLRGNDVGAGGLTALLTAAQERMWLGRQYAQRAQEVIKRSRSAASLEAAACQPPQGTPVPSAAEGGSAVAFGSIAREALQDRVEASACLQELNLSGTLVR